MKGKNDKKSQKDKKYINGKSGKIGINIPIDKMVINGIKAKRGKMGITG